MDFILKKINNALSLSDPGSYDYITYLRSRIEYSLFLCLGLLWKNFDKLDPAIQQGIISDLNKLSIGAVVGAIRSLDTIKPQMLNKKCKNVLDSYPSIRNAKIGHGYEMAGAIASSLEPLYNEMVKHNPILQENCDIIVVQSYNANGEATYTGIRYPYNQGGEGVRWTCPAELFPCSDTELPRTYILYHKEYYKISPFVYYDVPTQTPMVFNSLLEKLIGKVRLCSVLPSLAANGTKDVLFKELIYLTKADGSRQISESNGTIMNTFKANYSHYIDVGFQKLVEDFLENNRAYVSATFWGHGGVGKTACIQKICYDYFNNTKKQFSYIIFITAKDRVYNPKTGKIVSGSGNVSRYIDVIKSIIEILFDNADEEIDEALIDEYVQRISNFNDKILIVIDDYETFEDSEKEKISAFIGKLNAACHKVIITTRNKRFSLGLQISCNELDCESTASFIRTIVREQYPVHFNDIDCILNDDDTLKCIHQATSGRPIFIYQFIYLFIQKGFQIDLISDIRSSPNAQEFLYGRIYQYLSRNAKYLFAAISTLTNTDLRFNLNVLEYVLTKTITEKDQFEESLQELVDQKIIELVGETYGRVYSGEILNIMEDEFSKLLPETRDTIKNLLDSIGGKNISGSISEAMLEQADNSRVFGNEQETVEKYHRVLNSKNGSIEIKETALKHLTTYLSSTRLNPSAAIKEMEEFLPLFSDSVDIQVFYVYLLWSQDTSEKEKAINTFQLFFSSQKHKKTDQRYLSYFALGTGYCIDFDIHCRKYSSQEIRNNQYIKTFNEYGKVLFEHVRKKVIKGKASLFHNIRVALVQTVKLCEILGRTNKYQDKIQYGLDICDWMLKSGVTGPSLTQIQKLQKKKKKMVTGHHKLKESESIITLVPQVEVEESDTNNLSESFSIGGKQYTIGDVVDVTIAKIVPYGAFATLDASTTGLIHISEIADRFIANINDEFVEGQSCKARIINIDYQTGRISLSSKEFHE